MSTTSSNAHHCTVFNWNVFNISHCYYSHFSKTTNSKAWFLLKTTRWLQNDLLVLLLFSSKLLLPHFKFKWRSGSAGLQCCVDWAELTSQHWQCSGQLRHSSDGKITQTRLSQYQDIKMDKLKEKKEKTPAIDSFPTDETPTPTKGCVQQQQNIIKNTIYK